MAPYEDPEVDEAIDRIAGDVARRSGQPDFHTAEMDALVVGLRHMEAARRAGDADAAAAIARTLVPALALYRPTNATSRAKAIVSEVTAGLAGEDSPPD